MCTSEYRSLKLLYIYLRDIIISNLAFIFHVFAPHFSNVIEFYMISKSLTSDHLRFTCMGLHFLSFTILNVIPDKRNIPVGISIKRVGWGSPGAEMLLLRNQGGCACMLMEYVEWKSVEAFTGVDLKLAMVTECYLTVTTIGN